MISQSNWFEIYLEGFYGIYFFIYIYINITDPRACVFTSLYDRLIYNTVVER